MKNVFCAKGYLKKYVTIGLHVPKLKRSKANSFILCSIFFSLV